MRREMRRWCVARCVARRAARSLETWALRRKRRWRHKNSRLLYRGFAQVGLGYRSPHFDIRLPRYHRSDVPRI